MKQQVVVQGTEQKTEGLLPQRNVLQRRATPQAEAGVAPPIVHEVLRSSGQPLAAETRAFMEPRFGHDFSRVRVHTDDKAAESARAVNARAYTVGRDVVFGKGQYALGTEEGRRLMAHELVHVAQQGVRPVLPTRISKLEDAEEHQALRVAANFFHNEPLSVSTSVNRAGILYREPAPPPGGPTPPAPRRIVYIDYSVFDEINRGNQAAANALRNMRSSGVDIRITEWTSREMLQQSAVPRTAAANRLLIQDLGIQTDQVVPFQRRVELALPNQTRTGTVLSPQDAQVVMGARAGGGEVWSFDRAFRNDPPNIRNTFGVTVASESTLLHNPRLSAADYRVGRRLLGLQPVEISLSGVVRTPLRPDGVEELRSGHPVGGGSTSSQGGKLEGKVPTESSKPPASTKTAPPTGGGRARFGGKAGGIALNTAKLLGPMILHMINQYFIAKEEAERAWARVDQELGSSNVKDRVTDIVEKQRLEIARQQLRGNMVYVTVSLKLAFTNDVLDSLSLTKLQLTADDKSSFKASVMSHDPIFSVEGKVWWVDVSLPIDHVELSRTEEIRLKLEVLGEEASLPMSMDLETVTARNEERNRLSAELSRAEEEEEKEKQEEIGRPSVIADPKRRAKQQAELADQLRRLAEKKKATESKKKEATPKSTPDSPSLLPASSPPPPSLLPGASREDPVEQAARVVKSAVVWAQKLEKDGTALGNRIGTNESPSQEERQTFLDDELRWRLAVKYLMNKFRESSREEALNKLAELLDRFGPKLAQIRTYLGGD